MDVMKYAAALYPLEGYSAIPVPGHTGGRNRIYICRKNGEDGFALRVSVLEDRTEEDYLAETEFVRYLAENGAPVADVIPSVNGRLVERFGEGFASLFACAKGILLADNGYRYREGAPLEEYFYNTGKTLGKIHRLSRKYRPVHRRADFLEKYSRAYIDRLIPDRYAALKQAIFDRLDRFRALPRDEASYGLVHFDFCDGNYHIDMNTGDLTVFDFDNCIYCWYMFDLAHVWTHGTGWYQHIRDANRRMEGMAQYFNTVLEGYRSETETDEELLAQLPLFIDMTLIESVTDVFECCAREGETPDDEDIGHEAKCLIEDIPYAGFGEG